MPGDEKLAQLVGLWITSPDAAVAPMHDQMSSGAALVNVQMELFKNSCLDLGEFIISQKIGENSITLRNVIVAQIGVRRR